MHTLMVIGGGLALLAVLVAIGTFIGGMGSPAMRTAARSFIPLWLLAAAVNMYIGVTQAGYTVAQELPDLRGDICGSGRCCVHAFWMARSQVAPDFS